MNPEKDIEARELMELTAYAIEAEPGDERTERVARLGRHLLWDHVSAMHGEDFAAMLPDQYWEIAYDAWAEHANDELGDLREGDAEPYEEDRPDAGALGVGAIMVVLLAVAMLLTYAAM